jgi:hypothetical protein
MFDWNAELEAAKHRVAELEDLVARLKDALQQSTSDATEATPVDRILERARRTLPVRIASLERARHHQRFIEQKIATGTKVMKRLPYLELAETCFKAANGCPKATPLKQCARPLRPSTPEPLPRRGHPRLTLRQGPFLRT